MATAVAAAAGSARRGTLTVSGVLVPSLIVLATVAGTELAAVAIHRHVMHGFGWVWHRSHHEAHDDLLEENDLYAVVFAGFAVALMAAGHWVAPLFWMSIGLVVYGVLYFMVHDGLVHQRWPFRHVPRRGYLKRLYRPTRCITRWRDGTGRCPSGSSTPRRWTSCARTCAATARSGAEPRKSPTR